MSEFRNYLKDIRTKPHSRPMSVVLYGCAGVGKTSVAAAIPKAVFMCDDSEDGVNTLKVNGLIDPSVPVLPPASSWEDVIGMTSQLAEDSHDFKVLVIETIGGIERLLFDHVCRTKFKANWESFGAYQRGYEIAIPEWRSFTRLLDRCRDKGMAIVLTAHSAVRPFKNPEGEDYDRFVPDANPKTWALTERWADAVFFLNFEIETVDDSKKRSKGRGGQIRTIYTQHHAAYVAKNRHSLPEQIDMSDSGAAAWSNLKLALDASRKGN